MEPASCPSGEHVRLEPLTEQHAEGLYKAEVDPDIWTWLTLRQPGDLTAMHDVVHDTLADRSRLAWAQIDTRTAEVAGKTSYYQIDRTTGFSRSAIPGSTGAGSAPR